MFLMRSTFEIQDYIYPALGRANAMSNADGSLLV
jgi:hypothetical protein